MIKTEITEDMMPHEGSFYSNSQISSIAIKLINHIKLNAAEEAVRMCIHEKRYVDHFEEEVQVGITIKGNKAIDK